MFIKNDNMKNALLRLRSSGKTVMGDYRGIFDVPDEDGKLLTETPGWSISEEGPQSATSEDPTAELRRRMGVEAPDKKPHVTTQLPDVNAAPPAPPAPPVSAQTPPAPPAAQPPPADEQESAGTGDSEESAEEGPDLASMSGKELIATAEEYGVKLTGAQKKMKVADLCAFLDKEIYGEQEKSE